MIIFLRMIGGRFFASEAAEPSAVIILKKIDMDRIEICFRQHGFSLLTRGKIFVGRRCRLYI